MRANPTIRRALGPLGILGLWAALLMLMLAGCGGEGVSGATTTKPAPQSRVYLLTLDSGFSRIVVAEGYRMKYRCAYFFWATVPVPHEWCYSCEVASVVEIKR